MPDKFVVNLLKEEIKYREHDITKRNEHIVKNRASITELEERNALHTREIQSLKRLLANAKMD